MSVCVCISVGMLKPQHAEDRGQLVDISSLLLLGGSRGSNAGHQPWQQAPLHTELSLKLREISSGGSWISG